MKKRWNVKPEVDIMDVTMIHENLMILLTAFIMWCHQHGKPAVVTSMISDKVYGRVSRTHAEGRAFDISVKGWSPKEIEKFVNYFNRTFKEIAAISKSDLKPRAAVYHQVEGNAPHIHLQVKP